MTEHVQCHDHSHGYMPLLLQFTPDLLMQDTCTFAQLVQTWHQANGMKAALMRAAPVICVQIDRLCTNQTGQIEKCSCAINLDSKMSLPVFCDDSLQCAMISYTLVSAASHFGIDAAGHYQAILKMQPTVAGNARPVQWLATHDNAQPVATWRLSPTLCQNITVAWFVRSDCLCLPLIPNCCAANETTDARATMAQIYELLRTDEMAVE